MDKIQAQTSHREVAIINKKKVKKLKKIEGKFKWRLDNKTVFSFSSKAKMKKFIKENYPDLA